MLFAAIRIDLRTVAICSDISIGISARNSGKYIANESVPALLTTTIMLHCVQTTLVIQKLWSQRQVISYLREVVFSSHNREKLFSMFYRICFPHQRHLQSEKRFHALTRKIDDRAASTWMVTEQEWHRLDDVAQRDVLL